MTSFFPFRGEKRKGAEPGSLAPVSSPHWHFQVLAALPSGAVSQAAPSGKSATHARPQAANPSPAPVRGTLSRICSQGLGQGCSRR